MRILLVLILLSLSFQAAADPFDWSEENLPITSGTLIDLKTPGKIRYRFAHRYSGFGHHEAAVEVSWVNPDGQNRTQEIFYEMVDYPPVRLTTAQDNEKILLQFAAPDPLDTNPPFHPDISYTYDTDQGIFVRDN